MGRVKRNVYVVRDVEKNELGCGKMGE